MRAKLKVHQKILIALVALVTMGLLLAVGVWAYDDAQKDQIAPGIKVGGVDVGGRSADSARKIIKREVVAPLQQPVVVSYDGKDYTLSPEAAALERRHRRDGPGGDRSQPRGQHLRPRHPLRGRRRGQREPRARGHLRQVRGQGLRQPARRADRPGPGRRRRSFPRPAGQAAEAGRRGRPRRRRRARRPKRSTPPPARRAATSRCSPIVRQTKPEVTTKDLREGLRALHRHQPLQLHPPVLPPSEAEASYTVAVGQQGLETPGGPLPRAGQAGRSLLARPQLRLGRRPGGPGDPAGPRRPAQGALDRHLRRRRHPRHR